MFLEILNVVQAEIMPGIDSQITGMGNFGCFYKIADGIFFGT